MRAYFAQSQSRVENFANYKAAFNAAVALATELTGKIMKPSIIEGLRYFNSLRKIKVIKIESFYS